MSEAVPPGRNDVELLRKEADYKTRLLNAVAHELTTPMTPIRLHLHMLRQRGFGRLDEPTRRSLEIIDRNVERLNALVVDILDVARLESDRFPVRFATVDLAPLVREAVEDYRAAAEAVGLRLEVDAPSDVTVQADPKRIVQVLHNLVRNAIRFTPPGGQVQVTLRRVGADAEVRVTDTGVGFDPVRTDRLFQPFSQLGGAIQEAFHGAGLGLYICRGILDLHGGRIWGTSAGEGRGATFGFSLPMRTGAPRVVPPQDIEERQQRFSERIRSLV